MEKITKEVRVMKTLYVAIDGNEFESENRCIDYENELLQKEKEAKVSRLKYNANTHNWASIANLNHEVEYIWFKIKNREELVEFCNCYEWWHGGLRKIESFEAMIQYPDYVCIVDYPEGGEDVEIHILSQMLKRTNAFMSQFEFDKNGNPA